MGPYLCVLFTGWVVHVAKHTTTDFFETHVKFMAEDTFPSGGAYTLGLVNSDLAVVAFRLVSLRTSVSEDRTPAGQTIARDIGAEDRSNNSIPLDSSAVT